MCLEYCKLCGHRVLRDYCTRAVVGTGPYQHFTGRKCPLCFNKENKDNFVIQLSILVKLLVNEKCNEPKMRRGNQIMQYHLEQV
eukprot:UN21419